MNYEEALAAVREMVSKGEKVEEVKAVIEKYERLEEAK